MAGGEAMSAWEEAVEQVQPAAGAAGSAPPGKGRQGAGASGTPAGGNPAGGPGAKKDKPKPAFTSFMQFVEFLFAKKLIVRRPGGAVAWCPEWHRHAEVIARLLVVWDEFEKAKINKTTSDWFLHHLDPHLAVIFNKNSGPFMACTEREHRELPALPLGKPEARMFTGSVFAQPQPRPKRTVAAARQAAADRTASASEQGQDAGQS